MYLLEAKGLRNAAIRLRGNNTLIELQKNCAVDAWMSERLAKVSKEVLRGLDVKIN